MLHPNVKGALDEAYVDTELNCTRQEYDWLEEQCTIMTRLLDGCDTKEAYEIVHKELAKVSKHIDFAMQHKMTDEQIDGIRIQYEFLFILEGCLDTFTHTSHWYDTYISFTVTICVDDDEYTSIRNRIDYWNTVKNICSRNGLVDKYSDTGLDTSAIIGTYTRENYLTERKCVDIEFYIEGRTGTDKDDHGEIVNAATIEDLCYAHGIAYNWSGEIHNKKIAYIPVDTQ